MKPGRPKPQPHRLREATPEQAVEVMRNDWLDPVGGAHGGRVFKDVRLPRKRK